MRNHSQKSLTSTIREFVRDHYVRPAIRSGKRTVTVRVGDVHREMKLNNRVPVVCQALTSKKFLDENSLSIVEHSGPPSGQSTSVTLKYELVSPEKLHSRYAGLLELAGSLKDVFAAYGGGENYLRQHRADFGDRESRPTTK